MTKSAASNIFPTNPSGNSTQANTRLSNSFSDKLFLFSQCFAYSQNSRLTVILSDPCNKFKGKDSWINTKLTQTQHRTNKIPASRLGNLRPSDSKLWGSIKPMVAPDFPVPFSDVYWPQSNFSTLQQWESKESTGMLKKPNVFALLFNKCILSFPRGPHPGFH